MGASADRVLVNVRLPDGLPDGLPDPGRRRDDAIAIRAGRILACGQWRELRQLAGPATELIDGGGRVAVPAFHDAHLHLLSWVRSRRKLDCRGVRRISDLQRTLTAAARELPAATWIRATGYDHAHTVDGRLPLREELDAAAPDHPVRVQHRNLHLDVLNTLALARLGLLASPAEWVERDPVTGSATGRLYDSGMRLGQRLPPADADELESDMRAATDQLLAWGVTSVQDLSISNDLGRWELFCRLDERDALRVRVFAGIGYQSWPPPEPLRETGRVRGGHVKLMVNEATTDPAALRAAVRAVSAAGGAVALHATSEAELAISLAALGDLAGAPPARPHRIEHASVTPDALLGDLPRSVAVVGQPALLLDRGDHYLESFPRHQHGWLHRGRSFARRRAPFAIGSDAPVTSPCPVRGFAAACNRRTGRGRIVAADERLSWPEALAAYTIGPARAAGAGHELGHLGAGALADIAVLEPGLIDPDIADHEWSTYLTIREGEVAWSAPST